MMRLTPARVRLFAIAGGSAPVIALVCVRLLDPFGAPPAADAATPAEAEIELAPAPRAAKPTQRERDAARHITVLTADPAPPTPFFYAPGTLREDGPDPAPIAPEPLQPPTPAFEVTALLGGGASHIAVINGTAIRVGQEIAGGWRLSEVHERERAVVLTHEDGRSVNVQIRR